MNQKNRKWQIYFNYQNQMQLKINNKFKQQKIKIIMILYKLKVEEER